MTQLLEQALDAISKLPPGEQDSIASMILHELADERRWNDAFAGSQAQLERMAEKVRSDIAGGHVLDVGIDEL